MPTIQRPYLGEHEVFAHAMQLAEELGPRIERFGDARAQIDQIVAGLNREAQAAGVIGQVALLSGEGLISSVTSIAGDHGITYPRPSPVKPREDGTPEAVGTFVGFATSTPVKDFDEKNWPAFTRLRLLHRVDVGELNTTMHTGRSYAVSPVRKDSLTFEQDILRKSQTEATRIMGDLGGAAAVLVADGIAERHATDERLRESRLRETALAAKRLIGTGAQGENPIFQTALADLIKSSLGITHYRQYEVHASGGWWTTRHQQIYTPHSPVELSRVQIAGIGFWPDAPILEQAYTSAPPITPSLVIKSGHGDSEQLLGVPLNAIHNMVAHPVAA